MRVTRLAPAAVCVFGLVAAVSASAARPALPEAAPAAPPAATAAPALAGVIVRPGVIHVGRAQAGPLSTAGCEQAYQVACYGPAQLRQAYDLPALYARGVTGHGTTIVIVDSYGSPTIRHDLGVQRGQVIGLPELRRAVAGDLVGLLAVGRAERAGLRPAGVDHARADDHPGQGLG